MPGRRELTKRIIGLEIDLHRQTGPGRLESVYAAWLDFRADILVAGTVILEIEAILALLPLHETQLQTSLRKRGLQLGW